MSTKNAIIDERAQQLAQLDEKRGHVLAKVDRLNAQTWPVYVSLLVDEMLAKVSKVGHEGDVEFAVEYYFGSRIIVLLGEQETYFSQLNRRLPNPSYSIEPFKTYFNKELANRGAHVELRSTGGWYELQIART